MGIDTRRTFQQLKTRLHRQIVDSIDMSKAGDLGEEEFRKQLKGLANHLASRPENNLQGRDRDQDRREVVAEDRDRDGRALHCLEERDHVDRVEQRVGDQ